MQVAGPYDLLGAVRRSLPKELLILDGERVPMEWYLADELPVTPPAPNSQPRATPHGVFRILPPIRPRNGGASDAGDPYRLQLTSKVDLKTFATGTLAYDLEEQDAESIQSVTSGPQLVVNGTFENYPTTPGAPPSWTGDSFSTLSREEQDVYGDLYSLRMKLNATDATIIVSQVLAGLVVGTPHTVTAWGKRAAGLRRPALLIRNVTDSTFVGTIRGAGDDWSMLQITFTPQAGKTYAVWIGTTDTGGALTDVLLFDNVTATYTQTTYASPADYVLVDRKSMAWTGTGAMPSNGTVFQVAYKHRMYVRRMSMDSQVTMRAIIKASMYKSNAGKDYPMSVLAAILGNSLEMTLRSLSGDRLARAISAGVTQEYTETITIGRVLSSGPLPIDGSGSLASWFVDFTLNVGGIFETIPVQAILEAPFTTSNEP